MDAAVSMRVMRTVSLMAVLLTGWMTLLVGEAAAAAAAEPFGIRVVDARTGRGVPMVELTTTSKVTYVTDSAGWVAFDEPGLMDVGEVWLSVKSHGYEMPEDGFGNRGVRVTPKPGGRTTVKLPRVNLAERLYRVTGQGIYADSTRLGLKTPLKQPNLAGQVTGQDTVQTALFNGKLYWFWGDTNRPGYPLGQFQTSGATSALPGKQNGQGGLHPDVGVDFTYFVGDDGFSRPMAPRPEEGVVWIDSLMVVPDQGGTNHLLCRYVRLLGLGDPKEEGLMAYNEQKQVFEKLSDYPMSSPAKPGGHPIHVLDIDDNRWYYFATPYLTSRVRADYKSATDLGQYEVFTPLGRDGTIERDASGRARWQWRRGGRPMTAEQMHARLDSGELKDGDAPLVLRDAKTNQIVRVHASSIAWNHHRKNWVMIAQQLGGDSSYLGELWYAEADALEGPWGKAVKIVTHDDYTFYNPRHHDMLDQNGGRYIYFEATYTAEFSGTKHPTPRYDYNQIMYRLDLADPQLRPAYVD